MGRPEVLSGEQRLGRAVRWVHVSELSDIGSLLRGGELVLTTGIALPGESTALDRYVRDLDAAGVHGLIVELGRKYARLPPALVGAARRHDLPLISLSREIPFVEVTEAVHTLIVDARVQQLERSRTIHERFNALALEGASVQSVLDVAAELTGSSLVLENLAHRVLGYCCVQVSEEALLADWERRSRSVPTSQIEARPSDDEVWISAPVGARGSIWGRLTAVGEPDAPAEPLVIQQAASTLTLTRLSERDQLAAWAQAHAHLLQRLHEHSFTSARAVHAEARALGVPLQDRTLLGVAVVYDDPEQEPAPRNDLLRRGHLERVDRIVADLHIASLLQPLEDHGVLLLVSLHRGQESAELMEQLARQIHADARRDALSRERVTIGVGTPVDDISAARRTLTEAIHVTLAAGALAPEKSYFELPDIRLRGLLHLLRDDSRLQSFVERELGVLLEHDDAGGGDQLEILTAFLDAGRNKSVAAARIGVSRPTLYARIEAIAKLLDADLDDVETCLSLHVAVLALRSIRSA